MARPTKVKAVYRLKNALTKIPEMKRLDLDIQRMPGFGSLTLAAPPLAFKEWHRDTRTSLAGLFDDDFNLVQEFNNILYLMPPMPFNPSAHLGASIRGRKQEYITMLDTAESLLRSMIGYVDEYWDDEDTSDLHDHKNNPARPDSSKVFLVHGKDTGTRDTVARFLETELGLIPIILDEQANRGLTIIQKFQQYSQVGFAVVLLTPDDVGSLRGEENNLRPRARQNVILELGYFISHLGLENVCDLKSGGLEIPSNYAGVLYIEFDGNWKFELSKELKAAGLDIHTDRAIGA